MTAILRPTLVLLTALSLLTGVVYPTLVTALVQVLFPWHADGSLVRVGDTVVGSAWIGQPFSDPRFFWPRPSATTNGAYDATASTGSNLGPSNPRLHALVRARIAAARSNESPGGPVPADLVTTSASGLDPHLSPAAAAWQAARVARARGIDEGVVRELIASATRPRDLGFLGEPRVSVLALNLALEQQGTRAGGATAGVRRDGP